MSKKRQTVSPEYFPEIFPEGEFPRYGALGGTTSLPEKVWTTETTHRDGQQGGLPLTTSQSLLIYDILCRFTGRSGAIRQAEFFIYRESDRRALQEALERRRSGAPIEPTAWIRASSHDAELARSLGIRETGMLASISDYHTFHKFHPAGRRQAADRYLEAVQIILDSGIRPRLHLEDATRAPIDFMLAFIEQVRRLAAPYGEELAPKFRICDTLGLGLPFEDTVLPRSVPAIFRALASSGLEPHELEFHPHNDTSLVVANCLAAVQNGCGAINGTSLGKGERTGNAPLEAVLMHLIGMGFFADDRPDFTVLNELVSLYDELGVPVPPSYPLFGRDAHRTRAGIHADGLNKFWWMYAPFDVPTLLGRPLEVSLTKDSGVAGLIFLINQHRGVELPKSDPDLRRLSEWVAGQFDEGRQTSIEWEEIAPMVDRFLGRPVGSQ